MSLRADRRAAVEIEEVQPSRIDREFERLVRTHPRRCVEPRNDERPCAVTLYLDSQYVLKGITEWLPGWKAKGWKTASKQPVKNAELWRRLDDLLLKGGHVVDWRWVRGHNGDPGNERADALANMGVETVLKR